MEGRAEAWVAIGLTLSSNMVGGTDHTHFDVIITYMCQEVWG